LGITGAYAAYFLSGSGNKITMVDPGEEGCCASFNNPGGINPLHGPGIPGPMSDFAIHCHRTHLAEWSRISDLSGIDFDGRIISRLFIAFSTEEEAGLKEARVLYDHAEGFSAERLDGDALRRRDPRISPGAVGGLWTTGNASVDPGRYSRAVASAAHARGAVQTSGGRATGLKMEGGRIRSVLVESEELACDEVIVATGVWLDWFEADSGIRIPVRPIRGELLLAELGADAPVHDVSWKQFGVYHHSGRLFWLGGTSQDAGFDCSPTHAGETEILEGVSTILPGLKQAPVRRRAVGLRPMTPDGMPIIGRVPGCENAWFVLGSGSKGMLLGSGLGKAVADLVAGDPSDIELSFLGPERFELSAPPATHPRHTRP
jgi:glycine/D-amino acid oxidase-like deaminating enzyme